jgi:hypothetical protein
MPSPLGPLLAPVAEVFGLATGQFLLVLGLFLSVPLGFVAGGLPGAAARNVFNVAVGLGLLAGLYGLPGLNVLVSVLASWAAMQATPRHCGWLVCHGTLLYRRVYVDCRLGTRSIIRLYRCSFSLGSNKW